MIGGPLPSSRHRRNDRGPELPKRRGITPIGGAALAGDPAIVIVALDGRRVDPGLDDQGELLAAYRGRWRRRWRDRVRWTRWLERRTGVARDARPGQSVREPRCGLEKEKRASSSGAATNVRRAVAPARRRYFPVWFGQRRSGAGGSSAFGEGGGAAIELRVPEHRREMSLSRSHPPGGFGRRRWRVGRRRRRRWRRRLGRRFLKG